MDAFSRRIVGWAMETQRWTELVLEVLNMTLWQRRPSAVIHHSDQGCQYILRSPSGNDTRKPGCARLRAPSAIATTTALCESFFATLECELLDRRRFRTQVEAKMAVFEYIEAWYNPHRRHSGLDYCSPVEYKGVTRSTNEIPSPQPSTEPG